MSEKRSIRLTRYQIIHRWYGIWWDIFNLGLAIFVLSFGFIAVSILIVSGRMESLPFQALLWEQFIQTVSAEKQSEIGLSMLSISISASSAAALYLVRLGTARWAHNRRIGIVFAYFATAIYGNTNDEKKQDFSSALEAFLNASVDIFIQVGESHKAVQYLFEQARAGSNLRLVESVPKQKDVNEIALDLFCAALIATKNLEIRENDVNLANDIKERVNVLLN